MNQAQNIIPRLRRLSELEATQRQLKKDGDASTSLAAEIESMRSVLPTSILSHHDDRRARGKVSVAPVARGICRACCLAIPRGSLEQLRRVANELSVCDHCGAFIYLADEERAADVKESKGVVAGTRRAPTVKRAPRRKKTSDAEALPER